MTSQGDENMMISGSEETNRPGTTVEIKIKTLDSQTYTLRVDKSVPVPALKEQIALVTGVLSEQQRLICRGKVLHDDQLLSSYHVEDGHTLHLVVRQPVVPSSESSPDPASDSTSASGHRHGGRGPDILVGSFNISEQDGAFPDLSRVVSAVLGSFGMPSGGNVGEEIDLNVLPTERFSNTINGGRNSSTQQSGQGGSRISIPSRGAFPYQSGESSESLQPPVIPDSVSTLSLNLGRLRQEFNTLADEQGYSSQSSSIHVVDGQTSHAGLDEQRGFPTPAALGDVMLTARQVLHEQASECLLQLSRQLQGQANVIDVAERSRVQSNAVRSGLLFQNLGTMLLELGRTMMTVRMGNSPADSVVNAGPAVFLSSAGPNPIMVQPLPFQPGTSLGAFRGGTQQSAALAGGSVGSGVFPRNIDIRIRTVGSFVPISSIRRDLNGSQNAEQAAPVASDDGNMGQEGGNRGSGNSATRESRIRVVPLRTMITAVPASGAHTTSADASRSGMGILYPVLSRFQHSNSGNSGSTSPGAPQANNQHHDNGTGSIAVPLSAVEHETHIIPDIEHSSSVFTEMSSGQGMPAEIQRGFDRLLQTMFHGGNLPGGSNIQDMGINFVNAPNAESSPAAETVSAAATPSEEGVFLSNVLQHIMPLITENVGSNLTSSSSDVHIVADGNGLDSADAGVNVNGGTPSRQRDDPETSDRTDPKRQKVD